MRSATAAAASCFPVFTRSTTSSIAAAVTSWASATDAGSTSRTRSTTSRWVVTSDACEGLARRSAVLLRSSARTYSSTVGYSSSSSASSARAAFTATTEEECVRISRISSAVSSIIPVPSAGSRIGLSVVSPRSVAAARSLALTVHQGVAVRLGVRRAVVAVCAL